MKLMTLTLCIVLIYRYSFCKRCLPLALLFHVNIVWRDRNLHMYFEQLVNQSIGHRPGWQKLGIQIT